MVVETRLSRVSLLKISVQIGTIKIRSVILSPGVKLRPYLNSFSSSITCMPWSYCCFVGSSPTEAKWPFIVMTEGAVGNLEAADGRREVLPFVLGEGDGDAIVGIVG